MIASSVLGLPQKSLEKIEGLDQVGLSFLVKLGGSLKHDWVLHTQKANSQNRITCKQWRIIT